MSFWRSTRRQKQSDSVDKEGFDWNYKRLNTLSPAERVRIEAVVVFIQWGWGKWWKTGQSPPNVFPKFWATSTRILDTVSGLSNESSGGGVVGAVGGGGRRWGEGVEEGEVGVDRERERELRAAGGGGGCCVAPAFRARWGSAPAHLTPNPARLSPARPAPRRPLLPLTRAASPAPATPAAHTATPRPGECQVRSGTSKGVGVWVCVIVVVIIFF